MIIGSHDSWTFLRPRKWWMRMLAFTARCQRVDIYDQWLYGARCFDLRVKYRDGKFIVAHGLIEYDVEEKEMLCDLEYLDRQGGAYVRVIHEIRRESEYTAEAVNRFAMFCRKIERIFPNTIFWGGNNLVAGKPLDYRFNASSLSCCGRYASVSKPKLLDDWFPWLYARLHNRRNIEQGTDKEVLLIDFVDIR